MLIRAAHRAGLKNPTQELRQIFVLNSQADGTLNKAIHLELLEATHTQVTKFPFLVMLGIQLFYSLPSGI